MNSDQRRPGQAQVIYLLGWGLCVALVVWLLWVLSTLILPVVIGVFAAYICFPLLLRLDRRRIPRSMGLGLLFALFIVIIALASQAIKNLIPSEQELLTLRVIVQYKVDEKYRELTGRKDSSDGNTLYRLIGRDLDFYINNVKDMLMLDEPPECEPADQAAA